MTYVQVTTLYRVRRSVPKLSASYRNNYPPPRRFTASLPRINTKNPAHSTPYTMESSFFQTIFRAMPTTDIAVRAHVVALKAYRVKAAEIQTRTGINPRR